MQVNEHLEQGSWWQLITRSEGTDAGGEKEIGIRRPIPSNPRERQSEPERGAAREAPLRFTPPVCFPPQFLNAWMCPASWDLGGLRSNKRKGDRGGLVVVVTWGLWFINLQSFKFHGEVTHLSPRGVILLQRTIVKCAVFVFNCRYHYSRAHAAAGEMRRGEGHPRRCATKFTIPSRTLFLASITKRWLAFPRIVLWKTLRAQKWI